MRNICFFFAVTTSIALQGQDNFTNAKAKLQKINSLDDVTISVLNGDSTIMCQAFSSEDTTQHIKPIMSRTIGEIFTTELDSQSYFVHKVLDFFKTERYRIQYIMLDLEKISPDKADTLKKEIQMKLDRGASFGDLASRFSMDGNAEKSGDSGWFLQGQFYQEIEDAMKSHAFGDIFYGDILGFHRLYIIKNAYRPEIERKMLTVCVKVRR